MDYNCPSLSEGLRSKSPRGCLNTTYTVCSYTYNDKSLISKLGTIRD